ncbi:cation/H(+) antiporter 2-like [Amaranthus tricolor]|uniref:cation/H(+) antiporter 2-like n=1 Tax=Amaranthus tricolor TaxID=29722 RepID=UPI00258B2586|nr:cation/H(+) antiporter 2-like [Amaranthus tricolor]
MDVTRKVLCGNDLFNPVIAMGLQASLLLSVSHLLQIAVKSIGIPTPIPQITAGLLIGHSLLSKIKPLESYFIQSNSADYYNVLAFFGRTCVVFLIGLELDIAYMKRYLRSASIVTLAASLPCIIISGAISVFMFQYFIKKQENFATFLFIFMLSVANSASPLVIRFIAELRLGTSEFGRLAVCSSLLNDITCILCGGLVMKTVEDGKFKWGEWIWSLLFTAIVSFAVRRAALLLNKCSPERQYLKNTQIIPLFLFVLLSASFVDRWGAANSLLTALVLGVTFPRQGKTARTMTHKLSYAVYTFVLPIYFGYTGFQANFADAAILKNFVGVIVIVTLSISGKILGALIACQYLKIPLKEGIVLGLLLNLKGHFDVMILGAVRLKIDWNNSFIEVMLMTTILNTLICGIVVAFIVLKDTRTFAYKAITLQKQNPEKELRVLACVHGPRNIPTMVKVIGWLSWSKDLPICAYLMHLVELLPKKRTSKMYHQLEDDELSDDDAYGGNDAVDINDGVDAFVTKTGIFIRQMKSVSSISSMFEDVCNVAVDLRASLIILPFHKHQRIDGKMEISKDGIRATNQRVLRNAPCTVAVLVDRGLEGSSQAPGLKTIPHVATLFFGGPDDREALSLSTYIALHLGMNLTVIRFLKASTIENNGLERINVSSHGNNQVLMAMPSCGAEDEVDNAYLEDFYNRYVTSGQVGYIEKHVKNGAQTAIALKDIVELYQLFIVGNGGRRNSAITNGMSDWEECPELGNVGDLLASAEFDLNCSVLIIQQYKPSLD